MKHLGDRGTNKVQKRSFFLELFIFNRNEPTDYLNPVIDDLLDLSGGCFQGNK